MIRRLMGFLRDEQAAEVTELAIVLSLIVALSVGLIISIGTKAVTSYTAIESVLP